MKRATFITFILLAVAAMSGCRSRVVRVTVINSSKQPISNIVVDYPGATFGIASLDPGKTFAYSIKPVETGPLKVQFTDGKGSIHLNSLGQLRKDDEGTI